MGKFIWAVRRRPNMPSSTCPCDQQRVLRLATADACEQLAIHFRYGLPTRFSRLDDAVYIRLDLIRAHPLHLACFLEQDRMRGTRPAGVLDLGHTAGLTTIPIGIIGRALGHPPPLVELPVVAIVLVDIEGQFIALNLRIPRTALDLGTLKLHIQQTGHKKSSLLLSLRPVCSGQTIQRCRGVCPQQFCRLFLRRFPLR